VHVLPLHLPSTTTPLRQGMPHGVPPLLQVLMQPICKLCMPHQPHIMAAS
jgi:hypothetical protein